MSWECREIGCDHRPRLRSVHDRATSFIFQTVRHEAPQLVWSQVLWSLVSAWVPNLGVRLRSLRCQCCQGAKDAKACGAKDTRKHGKYAANAMERVERGSTGSTGSTGRSREAPHVPHGVPHDRSPFQATSQLHCVFPQRCSKNVTGCHSRPGVRSWHFQTLKLFRMLSYCKQKSKQRMF